MDPERPDPPAPPPASHAPEQPPPREPDRRVEDAPRDGATQDAPARRPTHVVGVGASAGGLEALELFFDHMPGDTGMAFVVVQHLSPDYKSLMAEILSKHTPMNVVRVEDGMRVERDTVYLLPPRMTIVIRDDRLLLTEKNPGAAVVLPIDIFLRSLADDQGERAVGVILSGTGSDGMNGVRAVKAAGGIAMVQDVSTARFDGMPRAAISTGLVDYVLAPEAMPECLLKYARRAAGGSAGPGTRPADLTAPRGDLESMRAILGMVRRQTGIDFTDYKPGTIARRIERRMGILQLATLPEYTDRLRADPREVAALQKEMLIGVTRFFRDPEAFELLRTRVIPEVVRSTEEHDTIRVWVPACSTGEEAYTVAMLFAEHIAETKRAVDVKIFATDVDRDALEVASTGIYADAIAADVSPERLERFFVAKADTFVVNRALRQMVLFAAHNVLKDPPFTRLDLVTCRNLLIYLDASLQARVLGIFGFVLKPGRYLLLGASESIGDQPEMFHVADVKWKLFTAVGQPRGATLTGVFNAGGWTHAPRARLGSGGSGVSHEAHGGGGVGGPGAGATRSPTDADVECAYEALVADYAPTAVLVDENDELVHTFGDASGFLRVPSGAVSLNVFKLLPHSLAGLAASAMQKARREQQVVVYQNALVTEVSEGAPPTPVTMRVRPLTEPRSHRRLLLMAFERPAARAAAPMPDAAVVDVSAEASRRITDLQSELQFTKENLQATIEELETSNEELQAANEELQAANEELQSTNEELQSVNEELHTVNAEHQTKIHELTELNNDIDNLLRSTNIGTLFLDERLLIRKFTPAVAELVNLMPRDLGRPIEHISLNLGAPGFVDDARAVLATHRPIEREHLSRDGRYYLTRVLPYMAGDAPGRGVVVTFIDVTDLRRAREELQRVIDSLPAHIAVLDPQGAITMVNAAWRRFTTENAGPLGSREDVGANYLEVCRGVTGEERSAALEVARRLEGVLSGRTNQFAIEYPCHSPLERRWFLMHAAPIEGGHGGAVISHVDITQRVLAEQGARTSRDSQDGGGPASGRGSDGASNDGAGGDGAGRARDAD